MSARFIDASMHRDTCHALLFKKMFFFCSLDTIILDTERALFSLPTGDFRGPRQT